MALSAAPAVGDGVDSSAENDEADAMARKMEDAYAGSSWNMHDSSGSSFTCGQNAKNKQQFALNAGPCGHKLGTLVVRCDLD